MPFANIGGTGEINVSAGSTFDQNAWSQFGTVNLAGGTIQVSGSAFTNFGTINGNGTIRVGAGTGTFYNNGGTISPGGSGAIGTINVSGNLLLDSGSTLDIELAGIPTSNNYDKINVTGNTTLDGTLRVSEISPHTVSAGQSYAFITGTTTPTGAFSFPVINLLSSSGNVSIIDNEVRYNIDGQQREARATIFT